MDRKAAVRQALFPMRIEPRPGDGGLPPIVKRLTSRELREPEAWARLVREGELLERLGGVVTPRLLARGDDARGPFVELERVAHRTLAEHIEAAGAPLDAGFVARVLRAGLAALAFVHERHGPSGPLGIVHGDVSPANVTASDSGDQVVLLDFDLALTADMPDPDGAFRGTLRYAAPEVARGERPDVRSDVFGFAASLLHALTNVAPRAAQSFPALLAEAAEVPVLTEERAAALAARGPAEAVIAACLAFDRDARPSSARDALARL